MREQVAKVWDLLDGVSRRRATFLIGAMAVGSLLDGLGLGLVLVAVQVVTNPAQLEAYAAGRWFIETFALETERARVYAALLLMLVFYLIKNAYLVVLSMWLQSLVWRARTQLATNAFARYLGWDYSRHLKVNSTELLRNILAAETAMVFCLTPVLRLVADGFVLIAILCSLLIIEPTVTVSIMGTAMIAGALIVVGTRTRMRGWSRGHHESQRRFLASTTEALGAARDIKLYEQEANFVDRFSEEVAHNSRLRRSVAVLEEVPRFAIETLLVLSFVVALAVPMAMGRNLMDIIPFLAVVVAGGARLMPALLRILGSINNLRFGQPALDALHADAVADEGAGRAGDRREAFPFDGPVEMRDVTFSYEGAEVPALKSINATIRPGQSIGLVGASGSGKTTFASLLLGLQTPAEGRLTVNGRPIADPVAWRRNVAVVSQDVILLDDTIRRNVAFGLPDEAIDEQGVLNALELAQLTQLVASLPDGVNTLVGERGARLSGGQRQRIAIARALYFNRRLLILDEATSALDTRTEEAISRALDAMSGNITTVLIAHRLSTVRNCDQIYVFAEGRIVAAGTFDALVEHSAEFRTLIQSVPICLTPIPTRSSGSTS